MKLNAVLPILLELMNYLVRLTCSLPDAALDTFDARNADEERARQTIQLHSRPVAAPLRSCLSGLHSAP
jgi:hypothetical protein